MKIVTILICTLLMSCGRYSWQDNTKFALETLHETGVSALPVIEKLCDPILQRCIKARLNPCYELNACSRAQLPIFNALESMQRAVKSGLLAVDIREQGDAQKKLIAAFEILAELRATLAVWGVKL